MGELIFHVEDEMDIVWTLEYNLKRAGFRTQFAATGLSAISMLKKGLVPDLVLLDVMLPDLPGTEVCRKLRSMPETRHVPVVMLTAKEEEADRLAGFEAGADDYVVKPFSVRELLHRIRAHLRRRNGGGEEPSPPAAAPVRIDTRLSVDPAGRRVWVDGVEVVATEQEFAVLSDLLTRRTPVD